MSEELAWVSGDAMAAALSRRETSPVEPVDGVLDRLEHTQPHLNAFVSVLGEQAPKQAREAETVFMTSSPEEPSWIYRVP